MRENLVFYCQNNLNGIPFVCDPAVHVPIEDVPLHVTRAREGKIGPFTPQAIHCDVCDKDITIFSLAAIAENSEQEVTIALPVAPGRCRPTRIVPQENGRSSAYGLLG
jgi:hypothetical protein